MAAINTKQYISLVATLGLGSALLWIYWYGIQFSPQFVIGTVAFGVVLTLVGLFPIRVSERGEVDASDAVLLIAVIVLGPFWATVASLPYSMVFARRDPLRTVYETSRNTLDIHIIGIILSTVLTEPLLISYPDRTLNVMYAVLVAAIALTVSSSLTNAALLRVKYEQSFKKTWNEIVEPYLISDGMSALTTVAGVLALLVYGPVAAIVMVVGAVGSQVIVYRARDKVSENAELRERIASLEESLSVSNLTFGAMMIEDLGRQDGYTHLHAAATSVYCTDIASELNLEPETTTRLGMAGLLHNIGMFGMPRELLRATGSLNSIAKARIREHPVRGEEALASVPEFREMSKWVRWHHERPDGRGYPDRLRANWIPLQSRILAVAQAYAAMVLDQPRRPGLDPSVAREQLNLGAGSQFDEVVVRAFLRILDTESEGYRSADDHRFGFGIGSSSRNLENTAD